MTARDINDSAMVTSSSGSIMFGDFHPSLGEGRGDEMRRFLVLVLGVVVWPSTAGATAIIVGIGDLPGGDFYSQAVGVSSSGPTVVGRSATAAGDPATRFTPTEGIICLGDLPSGTEKGFANPRV